MKALKTQGTITFPKKSSILEGNGWLVFIDASTVMKNTHCFQFPIWQGETKSDQKKKKKKWSLYPGAQMANLIINLVFM